jgi:hypothetical protein
MVNDIPENDDFDCLIPNVHIVLGIPCFLGQNCCCPSVGRLLRHIYFNSFSCKSGSSALVPVLLSLRSIVYDVLVYGLLV